MKITINKQGKLIVPENPTILFIEGDGIGRDICSPSLKVIDAAVNKAYDGKRKIEWKEVLAGGKAIDATGDTLPKDTVDAISEYLVGIKGPLMTPIGKGFKSINVTLRQTLDLFVCLRPVKWFEGVPSPVKHPENVDVVIFRENTEDIYAGIEYMHGTEENEKLKNFLINEMNVKSIRFPETSSLGIKPISQEGSERIVRSAIEFAIQHNKPSVTIVHKGNIMKYTEGAFKNWGYLLAEKEFGDQVFTMNQYEKIKLGKGQEEASKQLNEAKSKNKIIIKDVICDAFLQESLLHPQDYSVIVTMNLNGDYISDQIAAMVGGIGISPGGNINYKTGHAIFEATHGTAPNIAGKDIANPSSFILSAVMMLEYMGWIEAAEMIQQAMTKTILNKKVTADLHSMMKDAELTGTNKFCQNLIASL
jgi:isocitrate dehydrogenase